jgi:hypothetical protein
LGDQNRKNESDKEMVEEEDDGNKNQEINSKDKPLLVKMVLFTI